MEKPSPKPDEIPNSTSHVVELTPTSQDMQYGRKGWKTTPYILGNEISERIASFGLTWSIVIYLVRQYKMEKPTAAYIISITSGITSLAPLIGGFLADSYLGRYRTIVIGSVSQFLGMACLLMTAVVPALTPCKGGREKPCEEGASTGQLLVLYLAFLFLAVGSGGLRSCSYAFGADQFPNRTIAQRRQLQSFFNWYYVGVNGALICASTILAYLQLEVSWTAGFGLPTALMVIAVLLFLAGSPLYSYVAPGGSPLAKLAHVAVAAFHKRKLSLPSDDAAIDKHLYQGNPLYEAEDTDKRGQKAPLVHTNQFRFLDKAAIKTEEEEKKCSSGGQVSKWRLCEVQHVEALKCVIRVIPIWLSGIIPGANLIQQGIWIPLQASSMNRHLGHFKIPETSIPVFGFITTMLFLPFYDKVLVPMWRRHGGSASDPVRGITLLQRIGIGHVMVVLSPVIGALVEDQRRVVPHLSMHVLWLAPQLVVLGVADAFNIVGQVEFLYDQVPYQMRSMALAMFSTTLALGSFVGTVGMAIVQKLSHHTWIKNDLSAGHLNYYYFYLAGLLTLNCIYYLSINAIANFYRPSTTNIIAEGKLDVEKTLHSEDT